MRHTTVDIGLGSAYDFFFEIASPNHREFQRNQSRLAALNAAWPLWHMCEWYVWEHHPREAEHRRTRDAYIEQKLVPECPELGGLRDIVEAGKHFRLGWGGVKVRAISRCEEISATFGDAPFGTVPFGSGSGMEFFVNLAGTTHPLKRAVGAAFRYWLGKVLPPSRRNSTLAQRTTQAV